MTHADNSKLAQRPKYYVDSILYWRDYKDQSKKHNKPQTFRGQNKEDVDGYIKYYCLKFGMCDVKTVTEGAISNYIQPIQEHEDTGSDTYVIEDNK
jgi:hypothetical protein